MLSDSACQICTDIRQVPRKCDDLCEQGSLCCACFRETTQWRRACLLASWSSSSSPFLWRRRTFLVRDEVGEVFVWIGFGRGYLAVLHRGSTFTQTPWSATLRQRQAANLTRPMTKLSNDSYVVDMLWKLQATAAQANKRQA